MRYINRLFTYLLAYLLESEVLQKRRYINPFPYLLDDSVTRQARDRSLKKVKTLT